MLPPSVARTTLLFMIGLFAVSAAPQQFARHPKQHLPFLTDQPGRLAVADIDGDGDQDVVAAGSCRPVRVLRNGAKGFTDVASTAFTVVPTSNAGLPIPGLMSRPIAVTF